VADISAYRPTSVATAVTHTSGIGRIRVSLPEHEGTAEHMSAQSRVYSAMADAGVSLDMFTPLGDMLVFTVDSRSLDRAAHELDALSLPHHVTTGLAKVTVVGAGMHGVPGVVARVARCLAHADVHVLQTADSHTTISVLVSEAEAIIAVRALHEEFDLG
jgi:aspartate kinase